MTSSSKPLQVLGIDLGGTAIKFGRFDAQGHGLQFLTLPTPQPATPDAVLQAIAHAIPQIDPDGLTKRIGIGTPGPADATERVARLAINLPDWVNVPVADWIEQQTQRRCTIANDANCAALGEAWKGAGRNFAHVVLLTLGTGVGGGIVINKQLFVGAHGAAGELGSITFTPDGHPCNSGNRGSLEQQLCIRAIQRRTGKDPEVLGQLAQSGDAEAIVFWQDYGRDLGIGLATLLYILNPEAILIGGGISASSEFFFPAAIAEINQRVSLPNREGIQLLKAELGNQAGMVGAAKLALDLTF